MSVWFAAPSARPVAEVNARMDKWRDMGYKIALWRDPPEDDVIAEQVLVGRYPGYAVALNMLAADVLRRDRSCDWIVAAGDDTDPDPAKRANDIARECSLYFLRRSFVAVAERYGLTNDTTPEHLRFNPARATALKDERLRKLPQTTFGVMQPTGDPWADHQGRIIERIAGSPWLGREWCKRAYGGKGPLWPEFYHCFADEHLQNVAIKLGIFWQRPDLTHYHDNWARKRGDILDMPEFLRIANSSEHWRESKTIFERLKAGGFAEANDLLLPA